MYYISKTMTNEAVKVIPSKQSRILDRLVIKALTVAQKVASMVSSASWQQRRHRDLSLGVRQVSHQLSTSIRVQEGTNLPFLRVLGSISQSPKCSQQVMVSQLSEIHFPKSFQYLHY